MSINAFPIDTVPPTADLIIYSPSGPITATNVQAAITQLAGLIPSPGPGTDPLFLTGGFSINTADPTWGGDANDIVSARFSTTTDGSQNNPSFSNVNLSEFTLNAINGQATYGGGTNCKITFLNQSLYQTAQASGQKFLQYKQMFGYGMSDTGIEGWICQYAGGPINGDEGQCFMPVSNLVQQGGLTKCQISNVTQSSITPTTTAQVITASKDPQTVLVTSTVGLATNDWVVIEQQLATPGLNMEAVKVTAFGPGTITAIFRCNHASGVTITPALRLVVSGVTNPIGQDRYLVNLDKPSYSTGTISNITGACVCTGVGTIWATNMVGGNATNIGCISLAADDYTDTPFDAGSNRLRSWNAINQFSSATSLGFISWSVAGNGGYKGKGPGAGSYIIRQSAKVLCILLSGELICETSTSTWSIGDHLEQAICPYPDVTGIQWHFANYTNGGTLRGALLFANVGARTFQTCISLNSQGIIGNPLYPSADSLEWAVGLDVNAATGVGVSLFPNIRDCAIRLGYSGIGAVSDMGGSLIWGNVSPNSALIGPNSTNEALQINTCLVSGAGHGQIFFKAPGHGGNPDGLITEMQWLGYLHLMNGDNDSSRAPYFYVDNVPDQTNFERFFVRSANNAVFGFKNAEYRLGVEQGGTGNSMNLAIFTGGGEHIRFIPTNDTNNPSNTRGKVKWATPNWSANGAVATALTSVGPTGASTTVQKWLTIIDDTNTTRYIPCF